MWRYIYNVHSFNESLHEKTKKWKKISKVNWVKS